MSVVIVQCEGCGQDFERRAAEVARSKKLGRKFYYNRKCLGKNRDNSLYAHTGDATWLTPGNRRDALTPFRWYMKSIRYRCQYQKASRLKETDLVIDDLIKQWTLQSGICPHTGWELILPDSTNGWMQGLKPNCASIDRIDSSCGYVKGNIVFVAVIYNFAKNAFSEAAVLKFCEAVAENAIKQA